MLPWQKYCCEFINYVCPKGSTGKISLCSCSSVCCRKMDWLLFLTCDMVRVFSCYNWSCKQTIGEDTSPADLYSSFAVLLPVSGCSELCLKLSPQPAQPCLSPPRATQASGMQRLSPPSYLRGYFCAACLSSVPRSFINILFQILWTSGIWFACLLRQWYPFRLVREGWRLKLPFFGKTVYIFFSSIPIHSPVSWDSRLLEHLSRYLTAMHMYRSTGITSLSPSLRNAIFAPWAQAGPFGKKQHLLLLYKTNYSYTCSRAAKLVIYTSFYLI